MIDALLLSEVNDRSLSTSKVFDEAISKVADAVEEITRPLIDVAVADPRTGAVKVGDVRVLLVRTCVSPSVTNLFSTEPSHDLQYPTDSFHCKATYEVIFPDESVVLLRVIPPFVPVKLLPFLSSISLSSTCKVETFKIVCVPSTTKSPVIVTVDPLSVIILSVNWSLPESHFIKVLPLKVL